MDAETKFEERVRYELCRKSAERRAKAFTPSEVAASGTGQKPPRHKKCGGCGKSALEKAELVAAAEVEGESLEGLFTKERGA